MRKYDIVSGVGYGSEKLVAFDKALLSAGIGDFNLIKLSSIIPENAVRADFKEAKRFLPKGTFLHAAYSCSFIFPNDESDFAVAGIGVGIFNEANYGIIMEAHGHDRDEIHSALEIMLQEAAKARKLTLKQTDIYISVAPKARSLVGCAFVGVPVWGD